MTEWTDAQRRAIESDARELVCSAAAGSGKTAVLVERIIRFLKNGAEPDSFLVITFTNAAASEMREKIRNRLIKEKSSPVLRWALDRIDLMQISTIHSFCQQLVRGQFQFLGLDPMFTICDASRRAVLFHESFLEACGQLETEGSASFALLKSRFDGKNVEKMVSDLDPFLMSLPEPMKWLKNAVSMIPDRMIPGHPWFETARRMAADCFRLAETPLRAMEKMFEDGDAVDAYRSVWEKDRELFHVKLSGLLNGTPDTSRTVFPKLNTPRGLNPRESDWKDRYQTLRNDFKKQIGRADGLISPEPERQPEEWKNIRESLSALAEVTEKTEEIFREKKKGSALADFQDLEQYAVELLSDPDIREETRSVWRHVFVDECQDVSAVQNRLIDLLRSDENHLFMVGDVKQSIYRFRLADPLQFLDRIRDFSESGREGKECVRLQSNFRSRPEILETTNLVFRAVMREASAEMDYTSQDELIPGRKTDGRIPVRADILSVGDGEKNSLERTADHLAREIRILLKTPFSEKKRNYQYRDCVILMPAVSTDGPLLTELLEKRGIPVFFDGSGDYYQRREIRVVRNLLEWIDNPLQDLPLISVLTNAPFFFTEETLARIRLNHPDRAAPFHEAFDSACGENTDLGEACRRVREQRRKWQEQSDSMRLCDFIWLLLQETGIYWALSAEKGGEVRQAGLRMLAEEASRGERSGVLTLRQFLRRMRDRQTLGDQQSATMLGDQDDLVRIMTIHKSKGLQFPVVFCCGMDQKMLRSDEGSFRFHAKLGLCVDFKDPEHRISRPTPAAELFLWRKLREELAEKIRMLYVAMTRAQERLFLITCREINPLWSMPEGDGRVLSADTYTDLWMPALMQHHREILSTGCSQRSMPYEITVFEGNTQESVENRNDIHNLDKWLETLLSAPVVDELWKEKTEEPAPSLVKRSVTSLIRSARLQLEEDDREEDPETKRIPEALARRLTEDTLQELPPFMREKTAAAPWKGTLTHRMLSVIDLTELREGRPPDQVLEKEKERMLRNNLFTPEEMRLIPDGQILSFLRSPMGQRAVHAKEIHREWNFNLRIRRGGEMILQGVIDCAFLEEDGWVVLDYKTDRVEDSEKFTEEYLPQLMWYKRAVEELTGRRVKEAALYSLTLNRVFPVFRADGETAGRVPEEEKKRPDL